jgi:hypothetical protein
MERLFGHLFSNVMGYMMYKEEETYLITQWECTKTTPELCIQLRHYRKEILPYPRLEDFIRYYYKPCEPSCPYYMAIENALPLLIYSIRHYGKLLPCPSLYAMALFQITENRYPSEIECVLFEQVMNIVQHHDEIPEPVPTKPIPFDSYVLKNRLPDVCCICQEPMEVGHTVMTLPCMHSFHTFFHTKDIECPGIDKWLARSDECPLCKQSIR